VNLFTAPVVEQVPGYRPGKGEGKKSTGGTAPTASALPAALPFSSRLLRWWFPRPPAPGTADSRPPHRTCRRPRAGGRQNLPAAAGTELPGSTW